MVTFRLADSLPRDVYDRVLSTATTDEERYKRSEAMMDQGRGQCILRQREYGEIVESALRHFDGERYRLLAWVCMPNHAHVLIETIAGFPLSKIMHSWKSFTANEINRLRGTAGTVWAPDYHDRYIRNAEHYERAVHYIEQNPVKAGLTARPQDWLFSSARVNVG